MGRYTTIISHAYETIFASRTLLFNVLPGVSLRMRLAMPYSTRTESRKAIVSVVIYTIRREIYSTID